MGTLKPVDERTRINIVHSALVKLGRASGRGQTISRRHMFHHPSTTAKGPQWQFAFLKVLLRAGVIEKHSNSSSDVTYSTTEKGRDVVKAMLADRQLISNVLWPSRAVGEPVEIETADEATEEEPTEDEFEDEPDDEEHDDREILEGVLRLMGATFEHVNYLREKVDDLEKLNTQMSNQLDEMKEQLKELRDAWVE